MAPNVAEPWADGLRVACRTVTTLALGGSLLDSTHLLQTFGLLGAAVIIFAECGLLVGFFLPGDSLLFTAGIADEAHGLLGTIEAAP